MRTLALMALAAAALAAKDQELQDEIVQAREELKEIYDGDDSNHEVADINVDPAEIDYTITEATDFQDNRAEKMEYDEFSFDDYKLVDLDFKEFVEAVGVYDNHVAIMNEIRQSLMDHYKAQVAELNPVCEPGVQCRAEIKDAVRVEVTDEINSTIRDIKEMIKATIENTRENLEAAYTDAYYCDHGCECQFVETKYAGLLSMIEEHEAQIYDWNAEIDVIQAKIDGVPYECEEEFALIDAEYQLTWMQMSADSSDQIAALDDWSQDGWELESAVDQEKFEAAYGFKYDSARFDRFYENEDYYALE